MNKIINNTFPEKIAIVHDWFSPRSFGGAELVVKAVDEIFRSRNVMPDLACLVDAESTRKGSWLNGRSISTSFIQKCPYGVSHVQQYLPLLPFAIEQLDLFDYPLVISSSHLVAKGVLTSPDQVHISYIHTPARYAWDQMHVYLKESKMAKIGLRPLIRWQLHCLRQWDQLSSSRIDLLLANSSFTARRIAKYWGKEAKVIHPPVDVDRFSWNKPREDFYLSVCRLVPNKRVDLLVKAFNKLRLPLLIVGDGPQRNCFKKIAGPTVKIIGRKNNQEVADLLGRCRAFVYAGIEDFGIAPVEAMAAGAPVIALKKGGLVDTVSCATEKDSISTGLLFRDQTVDSVVDAVKWFHEKKLWQELEPEVIRDWANKFRVEIFKERFELEITKALNAKSR